MKREETRPHRALLILYRALIAVTVALVLILAAGTVYGLARNALRERKTETASGNPADLSGGESIFSGIGTVRVSTTEENPETVIITIAFPYDSADGPFSEELVSRIPEFKARTREYLGSFTSEQLRQLDVSAVNSALLERYNALLRLGKIRELFLIDYIWL
ncbi:MAG: hypothetical protein LBI67_11305 [Treponema sp.]|jgi:flagellar basal body-associated protein FliL|nr:hypothetical protein [Treponema sp.]